MDTYDFPYCTIDGENPTSGFTGQLGGSYVFTTPPTDPMQRIFTLHYPTMKYFVENGVIMSEVADPQKQRINMKALLEFYYAHELWDNFHFTHPIHGEMVVRFKTPVPEPEGIPNGNGCVKAFTVQLLEIP